MYLDPSHTALVHVLCSPLHSTCLCLLCVQIEKELRDISSDILALLDKFLVPHAQSCESKVFFHKMSL